MADGKQEEPNDGNLKKDTKDDTKIDTKINTEKEDHNNNTELLNPNSTLETGTLTQTTTFEDDMDTNSLLDDDLLNTSSDTMKQITEEMENLLEEVRYSKLDKSETNLTPNPENYVVNPDTSREHKVTTVANESSTKLSCSNQAMFNLQEDETIQRLQEDETIRRSARQMKRSTPDYTRLAKGASPIKKQKTKSKAPDSKERIKELKKIIETKDQLLKLNNNTLSELNKKINESSQRLKEDHEKMTAQKLENEGLKETVRKLKKDLEAHTESTTSREHHPDQTMRINELKRLHTLLAEQKDRQISTLTEANSDLLEQNKKLRETKGGHEKLEQELMSLRKENEQMNHELENCQRLLKNHERTREQMAAEYKELQNRYQHEMSNLENVVTKLRTENTDKQGKIEELLLANEEYREYNEETRQLNNALESLVETLKEEKQRHPETNTTLKPPPAPKQETMKQTRITDDRPTYAEQTSSETQNQDERRKKRPTKTEDLETRTTPKRLKTTPDSESDDNVKITIRHITQDEKAKILLITDLSNNRLIQQLKATTRDKTYTQLNTDTDIDSLERAPRNSDILSKIQEADQVVILVGLKDIRRGVSGKELCRRLDDITRDLGRATLTQIRLCQLPPTSINERIKNETSQFNSTLKTRTNYFIDTERIWTLKMNQALEENGHTLTDLGIERLAKDIDGQALPGNIIATQKKITKQIRKNEIPYIIGRDGNKIRQLQRSYRVQMTIRQDENENNGLLLVKGTKVNVEKALEEVKYILHSTYERTSRDSSPN